SKQFREDARSYFFAAVADFARGADATRAAGLAGATGKQLGSLEQEAAGEAEERRALADAARVSVVQVEVRLEECGGRKLLAERHAKITRIAYEQQRRHRAQRISQSEDAALFFRRRVVAEARQERRREMQPERSCVHLLFGHVQFARAH